jgi:hypothetical protein
MNVTSGAPPWPEGLSLRKLPIPGSSFARCIGLIWTRASLRLRLVQAFLELAATDPAAPKANTRKPKGYVPNPTLPGKVGLTAAAARSWGTTEERLLMAQGCRRGHCSKSAAI